MHSSPVTRLACGPAYCSSCRNAILPPPHGLRPSWSQLSGRRPICLCLQHNREIAAQVPQGCPVLQPATSAGQHAWQRWRRNSRRFANATLCSSPPARADAGEPVLDGGSLGKLALTVLGLVLLVTLIAKASLAGLAYLRRRDSQRAELTADEDLKAETGLKAEKRLQLEDEMKRRIAEKRAPDSTEIRDAIERTGEVVSIEEIESRIARGYYSEAERLLLDVIARTHGNHRAKLLLVEIYYLNERVEDFVRIIDEIHLLHRADIGDENWQRIMRMGKVLAPERAMFSGPTAIDSEA